MTDHKQDNSNSQSTCRFCKNKLTHIFVDLGMSPLCQTHIAENQRNHVEAFYPLLAYVCDACFLVQLDEYVAKIVQILNTPLPRFCHK